MNNRAMSPLVATLLLIAFSVLLGAIVMGWGEKYIEEKAEFANNKNEVGTNCQAAQLNIVTIQGIPQLCQRDDTVEVLIETAQQQLVDVHVRVIGDKNTLTQENTLSVPIAPASAAKILIPTTNTGNVLQVKLTPKVYEGKRVSLCFEKAIIAENIRKC